MSPSSSEDPIQAAIERSRQRREESMRRSTTENKKKKKPTGDIGKPATAAPERKAAGTPDLADAPKKQEKKRKRGTEKRRSGGGPQLVEEAKRKKGGDPQLIIEAERKKGGAPEMILEAERKKGGAPEMILEAEKKKGGAPELVEVPQEKKGGAPELVEMPQEKKGGGAELVQSPQGRKGADPEMIKVPQRQAGSTSLAAAGENGAGPSRQAQKVVAALSKQLEGTIGKQGAGWEIEYAAPLSITLKSGPRILKFHFQSEEASFDTVEILETRTITRRERKSGMLPGLKRLFGGSATVTHTEERERRVLGRNPSPDGRTFEWETDAEGAELQSASVAVTADYEDRNRRQELDIRLGNSKADSGGGTGLTQGGAVRAVNAVFAGLQTVLSS